MTTAELLRTLEQRGEKLILEGEKLAITPGHIEDELFDVIREKVTELKTLVRLKESGKIQTGADLERLRELFPFYGHWATDADGWTGQVWGITPRGLIVRGLYDVVYSVDFCDVVTVSKEDPREAKKTRAKDGTHGRGTLNV